jgi:tRNA pseudouridine13 synthase
MYLFTCWVSNAARGTVVSRSNDPVQGLAYAWGGVAGTGVIRDSADDFCVDEVLGIEPTGEGEHVFLHIRKRNLNTREVAQQIGRLAGVRQRNVSYAGLKDRNAVTSQVFSVHMPGMPDPDWRELENDQLQVLLATRHSRKIRRGALRGNHFTLIVRQCRLDESIMAQRLQQIAAHGVPNYFGPQRFGHAGNNLPQARGLFDGTLGRVDRERKSMLLSAVRSQLFNQVLSARVLDGSWNQVIPGDVMIVAGGRGQFPADVPDQLLLKRAEDQEVHPSGPLCGLAGRSLQPVLKAGDLESRVLLDEQFWLQGLERFGLEQGRRPLRLKVENLQWQYHEPALHLAFSLPAGSYATTLLRELLDSPSHTAAHFLDNST